LKIQAERGPDAAIYYMKLELLGEEASEALMEHPSLDKETLDQILETVESHGLGASQGKPGGMSRRKRPKKWVGSGSTRTWLRPICRPSTGWMISTRWMQINSSDLPNASFTTLEQCEEKLSQSSERKKKPTSPVRWSRSRIPTSGSWNVRWQNLPKRTLHNRTMTRRLTRQ